MSSDQTPTPGSAGAQSPATAKKRNPIERVIVWGLIVVLVGVSAREAVARFGYTNSLNSLQTALEADDDGKTLMLEQVPAHLSGGPRRESNETNRTVSYHWAGLLKDYGTIHIQYSDENEVLGLLTADAPPPPEPVAADEEDFYEPGEPIAEIGAAGAPAETESTGGGRRGFDFAAADADGDGKLSLEEAPDRMKERFAEIDSNGDGFIDEEELAASRAARNRDGGGRPQRPERPADTDDAANSTDDEAAATDTPQTDTPQQEPADANAVEPPAAEESDTPEDESAQPADQPSPE
jgi:hypothetical protein